jgi:hypothetical protein
MTGSFDWLGLSLVLAVVGVLVAVAGWAVFASLGVRERHSQKSRLLNSRARPTKHGHWTDMTDLDLVRIAARLAQQLIQRLHAVEPDHSTFDQAGLLDGEEVVVGYLNDGESGCALHHLLYMIHEADIAFPPQAVVALHELAAKLGEGNAYSKEALEKCTPEQRSHVYNRPE